MNKEKAMSDQLEVLERLLPGEDELRVELTKAQEEIKELLNQLEQKEKSNYLETATAYNCGYEAGLLKSNKLKDDVIEAYKNAYKVRSRLNVHNLYEALKEYGE